MRLAVAMVVTTAPSKVASARHAKAIDAIRQCGLDFDKLGDYMHNLNSEVMVSDSWTKTAKLADGHLSTPTHLTSALAKCPQKLIACGESAN